jgi:hypothetical protein
MDIKQIFLYISILLGFITPIIGVRSILKGEYKPQRITRLLLFIVTFIFVSTLFFQGDRIGLFLAIPSFIGSTVIFILSIKYGVGGRSKMDIITLVGALLSLLVWKVTDNPTLGLYASILTDFIGFSPTLVKSYKEPYTESYLFYGCDLIASFFNLLALKSYLMMDLAFPLYIFIVNSSVTLIILLRRRLKK